MPFNINNFKTNIKDFGYVQNNKFEVFMRAPNVLLNTSVTNLDTQTGVNNITSLLKFRTEEFSIPGASLMAVDIPIYGVGPMSKVPFASQNNELRMSLIADGQGLIWQFFHHWLNTIFEFTGLDEGIGGQSSSLPTYVSEFREDFTTVMQVLIYDPLGILIQTINIYDAFPLVLKDPIVSWSDSELMRINISMAYKEYRIVGSEFINEQIQQLQQQSSFANDDPSITISP